MEETELKRKNRRSETREGNITEEFETDINNEKKVVDFETCVCFYVFISHFFLQTSDFS